MKASYNKYVRSHPENQKAVTVQIYNPVLVVREMKWYFWKSNQSLTSGVWFAKDQP